MGALTLSVLLGCVDGLRSMTAPAAVCWAVHFGWLPLDGTRLAFIGRPLVLAIITVAAVGELVADKLPKTPARTEPIGLIARAVLGGACAFAVSTAKQANPLLCVAAATIAALLAAFAGYHLRHFLVSRLNIPDFPVALVEDVIAVAGGFLLLSRG